MIRYGIIGSGFISYFHLRALRQVRGVEVSALYSRTPPHELASKVRETGLGDPVVCSSIQELVSSCDVAVIFGPNYARLEHVEQIVEAVQSGSVLKGVICEKPLARTMLEARKMMDYISTVKLPTAYFENQIHMNSVQSQRSQLDPVMRRMGPPVLTRSSEEHAGPHRPWFWDPVRQGGGVMSDMGCHCLAVGWYALTPPDKPVDFLRPQSISADLALLKWGQKEWRERLLNEQGVDYHKTPAEDFATGMVTYRNPENGQIVKSQFTVSWMYEKQGLRLALDGMGPGYAFEMNSLNAPSEVFLTDSAVEGVLNAEAALEKTTASRGLLVIQPNEPDILGYTDENQDAVNAFSQGRSPMLNWEYGLEIVRLNLAAYLSHEQGKVIDLTDESVQTALETYIPLIQQGRGREVLDLTD